jgi:hypothetical protein
VKPKQFIYVLRLVPRLYSDSAWTKDDEAALGRHFTRFKKAVETGEKAVEFGEHVGRKAAEVGERAGKKMHQAGEAIGDFLQSRAASVGAAGTALLSTDPLAFVKKMTQAHASGDHDTFRAMTQSAANHGAGQQLRHDAGAAVDRHEHQANERAAQQRDQQQQETQQHSHGGRSR